MTPFLLFVFVFASQMIGGFNTKLPPPAYGNIISILSIDGGGIKGILPTVILQNLESALQNVSNDKNAALADYFDVITGTSTGGLITTLLAAPNPNDTTRPAFSTPEILKFYLEFGPTIFDITTDKYKRWNEFMPWTKFDGVFYYNKTRELLGETRLHDTLTNIVIPAFDIKKVQPIIFSSLKLPRLDAKLSDILLGTSAAPSELPAYYFKDGDDEFNLVDGALVSNTPALIAVSEVIQQLNEKNPKFINLKANEPTKIVLLSVGTGATGGPPGNSLIVNQTTLFSLTIWIPFIAGDLAGSLGALNDYHLQSVFSGLPSSDNYYLRIQEYNLDPSLTPENTTKEGMENLIKAGEKLLEETVKAINVTSFAPYEKPSEGTNAEALKRLAETLYKEKQLRLKMKSMEKKKSMKKMGQPLIEAVTSPIYGMK